MPGFSTPYSGALLSGSYNSGFITSDNETQIGVTFLTLPAQVVIMSKWLCICCFMLGNPSCTNFLEVKSVADDIIGKIMTTLQRVTLLLFRISSWIYTMFPSVIDADGCSNCSLSVTLVRPLQNMSIHLYTFHCSTLRWRWISSTYNHLKTNHYMLRLFGVHGKQKC
jgi:hypothetical protein